MNRVDTRMKMQTLVAYWEQVPSTTPICYKSQSMLYTEFLAYRMADLLYNHVCLVVWRSAGVAY